MADPSSLLLRPGITEKTAPVTPRMTTPTPFEDVTSSDSSQHEHQPLLPIFSTAHLDRIPVYDLQHKIRLLIAVQNDTTTTLSWDQLRSPQISRFLIKPIERQISLIRQSHLSKASLYALLATGLQFQREGQTNPGSVGTSTTRAMICELLAMRILRESNTREVWI